MQKRAVTLEPGDRVISYRHVPFAHGPLKVEMVIPGAEGTRNRSTGSWGAISGPAERLHVYFGDGSKVLMFAKERVEVET